MRSWIYQPSEDDALDEYEEWLVGMHLENNWPRAMLSSVLTSSSSTRLSSVSRGLKYFFKNEERKKKEKEKRERKDNEDGNSFEE